MKTSSCSIFILAAGSSGRFGSPKQILPYGKTNLLQHVMDEAENAGLGPVNVVLGAHADEIMDEIDTTGIHVLINKEWKNGMASSIVTAISSYDQKSIPDAVILMTCDQPFVSSALLNELWKLHVETGKPIVCSEYGNIKGPPVLFHRSLLGELLELSGDKGAKKIIMTDPGRVVTVSFPEGSKDIDSPSDYASLSDG